MEQEQNSERELVLEIVKATLINIISSGRIDEAMVEAFRAMTPEGRKIIDPFFTGFMELLPRKTTPQTPEWDFELHALVDGTLNQFEQGSEDGFFGWLLIVLACARQGVHAPSIPVAPSDLVN